MVDKTLAYDLWSQATRANPQALYARIRREDPVHRMTTAHSQMPIWLLTRYDDCVAMLKDQRFGKDQHQNLPKDVAERWWGPPDSPDDPWTMINRHMLNLDPPDHTRLRALVHKVFTPRMVEDLRPRIAAIADDLLDEMAGQSEADYIASFAFPLPIIVIAEMLGIPAADRDQFRKWAKSLLFSGDEDDNRESLMEFGLYMNALIDDRHDNPQDDIISGLVQAEEDGDKLDRMETMSMLFLLLVAGHETTVNLIGNGTLALIQHPDQFEKLCADPSLIKSAVEEMLRFNGPVDTTTLRYAFEDIDLGGTVIPKGDGVWASLLAANRDPAQFADPDTFDIRRDPNKHIAFGNGIHYCVGAPLARLEGVIAMNAMLKRIRDIDLAVPLESLEWSTGFLTIHGMSAMPVRYAAR